MIKKIWNIWKKITEKIGNFQATIIFSLLFYILITPLGIIIKLFTDFFAEKTKPSWKKISDNTSSLKKLSQQ